MFPDGGLSSKGIYGELINGKGMGYDKRLSYEIGGIALNDSSKGLLYQIWRGQLVDTTIILDVPDDPSIVPIDVMTVSGITEFSFTFDQNMQPVIVYMADNFSSIYFYDGTVQSFVTIPIGDGIIAPRVFLDDKRPTAIVDSDVLLVYLRYENLYYRMQRDRYGIEYLLKKNVGGSNILFGMNDKLRVQIYVT